jgi:hypothetical protein
MLDHRQLGLGSARDEKIDTARMLLVAEVMAELKDSYPFERLIAALDIPSANDVPRYERAAEMMAVREFYSDSFLQLAYRYPPPWHLLIRPPRWGVAGAEVEHYLGSHFEAKGSWPTVDALQVRFGRASNHRPDAAKNEDQGALL